MMPGADEDARDSALEQRPSIDTFTPKTQDCFSAAVQFLTQVSVPWMPRLSTDQYAETLRGAVTFFPLVGGCIGLFTSAIFLGLNWGLSGWIAALIALGCEALLTGAFHEDAWADTFDALGGGWTREQVLEIMKDSRLGTYGTLALVVGVGIRLACFAELASRGWVWALVSIVAASTLGRLAIVGMMVTTNPISDRPSQARDVSGTQTWRTFGISLIMTAPLWIGWIWLGKMQAAVTMLSVIAMLFGYRRYILRRVGGTTGDLLGCSAYLVQLAILVGSSWRPA